MKKIFKKILENWHIVIITGLLLAEAAVFIGFGEKSYITIHDNLDLFIPHLKMLQLTGSFFSHDVTLPFLGGITRDHFGSEFYLYNLLYVFLPDYAAYIAGYFLSIAVSMASIYLLAREFMPDARTYRPFILLFGLIYGILPVFPAYGLAFASIPLVVFLVHRIYRGDGLRFYIFLFLYPVISYFSYFGFFILGYLVLFTLINWIRCKRLNVRLLASIPVLFLGYALFEYRLFHSMLFSDTVTIRSTMAMGDLSLGEVARTALDGFVNNIFHASDAHKFIVMPVALIFLVIQNVIYFRKERSKIFRDIANLLFLLIILNCFIYGIYYFKPMRDIIFTLIPPLQGFQYHRTIFFNPFLWYMLLFVIVKRLYDSRNMMLHRASYILSLAALLVVVFAPANYNDFYNTCYYKIYALVKHQPADMLNYEEFYSKELFSAIKEDLNYNGEYSAAYGFHPAVLTYNGISTLDGYLGMYSQEYKESFRKVIAPALERSAYYRNYYDTWGARAYIFPGFDSSSYLPSRGLTLPDSRLYIDTDAFRELNGVYLFSRFEISNAAELSLKLTGQSPYTLNGSPYRIYVYRAE